MSSINKINNLYASKLVFFNSQILAQLLKINSRRNLENIISKLIKENVLTRLEKGKYILTDRQPSNFAIAQFLYSPSYISFETALNYHGILSQFPYEITCVTTKKRITKQALDITYTYSKVKPELFNGYYKDGNALIAYPEKALFDQLYMISKSLRSANYLDEMDFSVIKKGKFNQYLLLMPANYAQKINNLIQKYI